MSIDIQELISRMKWAQSRNLSEFSYTSGARSVTFHRSEFGAPLQPEQVPTSDSGQSDATVPSEDSESGFEFVTAPLGGICFFETETGTPYVKPGEVVAPGQTICVIEAMKMMTPVSAQVGGTIDSLLIENGDQVEAGKRLMKVRA